MRVHLTASEFPVPPVERRNVYGLFEGPAACGMKRTGRWGGRPQLTDNPARVDCKRCRERIEKEPR